MLFPKPIALNIRCSIGKVGCKASFGKLRLSTKQYSYNQSNSKQEYN